MSEFVTPMGEAMGAAREMYESALAAGFTDTQAMQLSRLEIEAALNTARVSEGFLGTGDWELWRGADGSLKVILKGQAKDSEGKDLDFNWSLVVSALDPDSIIADKGRER